MAEITDSRLTILAIESLESIVPNHEGSLTFICDPERVKEILSQCDKEGFYPSRNERRQVSKIVYNGRDDLVHHLTFQQYSELGRQEQIEVEANYRIRPVPKE